MNNKEYNIYEEELEMLRNEYITKVAYKIVGEELSEPNEEFIEPLTDKAIKEISNDGIVELDEARKIFVREMVEGAMDNLF